MPYRSSSDPRLARRLPLLDRVAVKTSCKASWDEMVGDEIARFCCTCSKNVYDLTAMHPDEAELFLEQHLAAGGPLPCARIYRRRDGRVLTSECPTGETRRHLLRLAKTLAAGAAGAALLAGSVEVATRPKLGPDVEEPESNDYGWSSSSQRMLSFETSMGELSEVVADSGRISGPLRRRQRPEP